MNQFWWDSIITEQEFKQLSKTKTTDTRAKYIKHMSKFMTSSSTAIFNNINNVALLKDSNAVMLLNSPTQVWHRSWVSE